jgi:hypothetical protein
MSCLLRVDESSLLLRADGGGRFTRVGFADLFEGNESDCFQAAVARGSDPTETGLVSWLVVYSSPKARPILNEPSRVPVRATPVPSGQPESN